MEFHATGAPSDAAIRFLSFCVDRRGGRLTCDGQPVPVRRKTWAVLVYLVERPGVLVTKGQLLDAVWPDIAVTPDVLIRSIRELRIALGDDPRTPRCVETVHRRGYRFIAETQVAGSGPTVSASSDDTPDTGDPQRGTPILVGRDTELQQLEALFGKARAGKRQIAFVTGPAGVGKTALVEAFLDSPAVRDAAAPVWIGRGACVDQHGTREACMCVLDALARLVRQPDAGRLLGLLRRAAPTWLVQMPWLVDDAESLRQSLQAARGERMLREFAALTEALPADVSLVLVLEDLHWCDPSTTDLLCLLGQRPEPARLLVIATYRPAEAAVQEHVLSQAVRTLQLHRRCVELPVHELTQEDVQQYLEARFPRSDFAAGLARVLHQHTDGNPLFMVAVVEHLLSRGWILDTAPGWALSTPLEKIDLGVPDHAWRMIQTQLEWLSPADRALLEAGSVAGVQFAPETIAAALGLEVGDAEKRCEKLARAHWFLKAARSSEAPDGSVQRCYAFTHELCRQAVYTDIPDGQRQRLHQRMGEALEAAYDTRAAEIAAVLALHFQRSGDLPRTLRYLAAAAARARQRFANREAVDYLEEALALAARLPDEGERRRWELQLRIALWPALSDMHGFAAQAVRENCERAYELCAQVGSADQLFQIVFALCHIYEVASDTLAPEMEAKLDDLARHLGRADYRLLADTMSLRCAVYRGRFIEACRLAEEGALARHAEIPERPFRYGPDPVTAAVGHHALALWFLGSSARAQTIMEGNLAAAAASGSPFTLAAALGQACILEVFCRNPAKAGDLADQAASLAEEQGLAYWSAMAAAIRGWARVQRGQTRAGTADLERALAAYRATGARLFSTHMLAFLAEIRLRTGAFDQGLAAVDEALALAESTLDRSYWPELWRLKGELLLAAAARPDAAVSKRRPVPSNSRHTDAERCLSRALELAHEYAAKALELRAATSLARAWHARQRSAQARALLKGICDWFGADADSPDLAEARMLLAELSTSATRRFEPVRNRLGVGDAARVSANLPKSLRT
jgi:DNA-binding winged helix-turn-helix (wHTH) protein